MDSTKVWTFPQCYVHINVYYFRTEALLQLVIIWELLAENDNGS